MPHEGVILYASNSQGNPPLPNPQANLLELVLDNQFDYRQVPCNGGGAEQIGIARA